MSHRSHRGTLVPFVMGVFAVLMVACAVSSAALGTAGTSAYGGAVAAGGKGIRAQEWWLTGLGVSRAWQQSKGAGVTVAVLSTGVSPQAPDLAGNVITGPDYSRSGRTPDGPYWGVCGTAVASVIAGHGHGSGGGTGMIGIAPDARILSLRVTLEYNDPLNASSDITKRLPGAIANGILYAVSRGAKVIDLPLDPATFGLAGDTAAAGGSGAERSAVAYAQSKGVLLVAAAGDEGTATASYPAAYPGVLAVGAVGRGGRVGSFSSRGSYVAMTAPGVSLMAAAMVPGTSGYAPGYSRISTTSVASGMVAGVAALVMSKYPRLPVAQVTRALRQSVTGRTSVVSASTAMTTAATLAASIKPAGASPPPASSAPASPAPVAPKQAAAVTHASAAPRAASAVASSVLRYAVYALGAMIALLFGFMLLTRARRRHTEAEVDAAVAGGGPLALPAASRPRVGGQHEQRRRIRGGDEPVAPAGQVTTLTGLRQLVRPDSAAASGWPDPAGRPGAGWQGADWQGAGWQGADWQGRGLGEIAHSSLDQAAFGQRGPAIEPLPKSVSRPSRGAASPPWAPAQAPDGAGAPLPPGGVSPFPVETENGIRVPADVPAPIGDAPVPYIDVAPPAEDVAPPFGDVPVTYVDSPTSLGGLTGPFAGRDVLTQSSFGFAAAPVPADYPAPEQAAPPELTHWNPSDATDPFPALPDPGTGQPDNDEPA